MVPSTFTDVAHYLKLNLNLNPNTMWQIVIAIIVTIGVCFIVFNKPKKKMSHVETLKNALLTFALNTVSREDFDDMNMNYGSFDGSKLPMLSGATFNNALTSYIIDIEEYRQGPFYTKIMEDKLMAINKYLENHFNNPEKVTTFLMTFIDSQKPKPI
jgi:hypothetical protein